MNKKNILVLGTTLAFLGILAASLASASPLLHNALGEQEQSYALAFGATKNRFRVEATPNETPAQGEAITELGGSVTFAYKGLSTLEGGWQSIAKGGYITNVDPIGGLSSITIHKSASSILNVSWNSSPLEGDVPQHQYKYEQYGGSMTEVTFDFDGFTPTYFSIIAKNDAAIEDITLSYSCHNVYPILRVTYDPEQGYINGDGVHKIGEGVSVTAYPNDGYQVDGWYDETGNLLVKGASYRFTMPECIDHYDLEARFVCTSIRKGTYPQTKVDDADLISALNDAVGTLPTQGTETLGKWESYNYYISGAVSHFMWHADIEYEGDKYRGVYFTSYRPYYTINASDEANSSQDDNGYSINTVYWFKYESILWDILDDTTNEGEALVLAHKVLDAQQFYRRGTGGLTRIVSGTDPVTGEAWSASGINDNNWKYSDLRVFANSTFYDDAFSAQEKTEILTKTVDNAPASTGSSSTPYACEDTQERVFALSYVESHDNAYGFPGDGSRTRKATDYAKCMGVRVNRENNASNGNATWWLRSPAGNIGGNSGDARYNNIQGATYTGAAYQAECGFLPASRFAV